MPDLELSLRLINLKNAPKLLACKIRSSFSLSYFKIASLQSFAILIYLCLMDGSRVRLSVRHMAALRDNTKSDSINTGFGMSIIQGFKNSHYLAVKYLKEGHLFREREQ